MAGLALGAAVLLLGRRQFGAGDYGSFSAHAWFLHLGFRPYSELVTAYPPLFLLGARAAFTIFGVRFVSLVDVAAFFATSSFVAGTAIFRAAGLSLRWAAAVALAIVVCGILPLSVWAYNPETAICAALFLGAAAWLHDTPAELRARAAFVATAALLGLGKPNVAAPTLVAVFLLFLATSRRHVPLVLFAGAGAVALAILVALRADPRDMIGSYLAVAAQRVSLGRRHTSWLSWNDARWESDGTFPALAPLGLAALAALPAAAAAARSFGRRAFDDRRVFALALAVIGLGASLIAWTGNHELKMSDAAPLIAGAAIWLARPGATPEDRGVQAALVATTLVLLGVFGVRISVDRSRVLAIGERRFYENAQLGPIARPPFFEGVQAAPVMMKVVAEIDRVVESHGLSGRHDAAVFFGPRLEFGDVAWGFRPTAGLPLLWDFYLDGDPRTDEGVRRFAAANFELCFFVEDTGEPDFTSYPETLRRYIRENYRMSIANEVVVFERVEALP